VIVGARAARRTPRGAFVRPCGRDAVRTNASQGGGRAPPAPRSRRYPSDTPPSATRPPCSAHSFDSSGIAAAAPRRPAATRPIARTSSSARNLELGAEIERCNALCADLSASEERFRTLTRLSSDWFWEQDSECRFVQITEGAHSTGGIPREAHVGKTRWELPHTEVAGGDWAPHRAVLARREPFRDLLLRRTVPGTSAGSW
jgi:PAS domain-containing protein